MTLADLLQNRVLLVALSAWLAAQALKPPLDYLSSRKWRWTLLLDAGGMPSSHSALIVGATLAVGLFHGFDNPLFGLAVALTMIVTYDAAGVRRQAGIQAERINVLVEELLHGKMWDQEELREVIGHTPLEVLGGVTLGIVVAVVARLLVG
jgi:hypothetical protein